jgi:hypothetical protein
MPDTPLLLLHGVRGASLVQMDEGTPTTLWCLADENHPRAQLLALQHGPDGTAVPLFPGADIRPGVLEHEIYGPFVTHFSSRQPLLAPAFDWRLAPGQSGITLRHLFSGSGSLDVVSHSMGLLMLLEALHRGWLDTSRLRRVVLVTPPFCGSADIVSLLSSGIDCSADDGLGERRYDHCLARSFPALYRLLPGADCSACSRDWLAEETWLPRLGEPSAMLNDFFRHLEDTRTDRRNWAAALHGLLDLPAGRVLILAGRGVPTLLDPDHPAEITREGDGRLPLCSTRPPGCRLPRVILGSVEDPVKHGEILADPRALAVIGHWLESGTLPVPGKDSEND